MSIIVNPKPPTIGDPVISGTAGSVLFIDASTNLGQDNPNFFWDDANNRLGIGTSVPSVPLHVRNDILTSGNVAIFRNQAGGNNTNVGIEFQGQGLRFAQFLYNVLAGPTRRLDVNVGDTSNVLQTHMSFYDDGTTSRKVGVGLTAPGSTLVARGTGATSATSSLDVQNSAGTSMLFVRDDGRIGIGVTAPDQALDVNGNIELSGGSRNIRVPGLGDEILIQSSNQASISIANNFTLNAGAGQLNAIQVGGANRLRMDSGGTELGAPLGTLANQLMDFNPGLWNNNAGWNDTGNGIVMFGIRSTVNQTGASGYIVLRVNITETATGSGIKDLLQLQTGGTNRLTVDNVGHLRFNTAPAGSTNEGSFWADSTQKALQTFVDAIEQTLQGTIFTAIATATVANTIAETTVVGSGVGTLTLPANFFVAGKTIRITVRGFNSNATLTTQRFKVKLGTTVVLDTGVLTPGISIAITNRYFEVSGVITCRTIGATGTVFSQGATHLQLTAQSSDHWEMTNTGTTTIDTTVSQVIDVTHQYGVADVGNTISGTNVVIEALN